MMDYVWKCCVCVHVYVHVCGEGHVGLPFETRELSTQNRP